MSFPVPHVAMHVKPRAAGSLGVSAGESTTHDLTYSGVSPLPWAKMPVLDDESKQRILGFAPSRPRVQLFDTALGQPLFWAERKPTELWSSLFRDLNIRTVVDVTPGSGTAAIAALELGISYVGIARNSLHANFLNQVLDRHALYMVRTAGTPLFHQEMQELVREHFQDIVVSVKHRRSAEDSAPDGECNVEECHVPNKK